MCLRYPDDNNRAVSARRIPAMQLANSVQRLNAAVPWTYETAQPYRPVADEIVASVIDAFQLLRRAICLPEPTGAHGAMLTNWPRWSNELLQQALDAISGCTDAEELRRVNSLIVDCRRSRIPFLRATEGPMRPPGPGTRR